MWNLLTSYLAQGCARTDSVEDYKLLRHIIKSQVENNIWSCFQTCKRNAKCQSINYNAENSICELNNRTKTGNENKFAPFQGSVYVDNPFRGRIGEEKDFPGISCKEIKDSQHNSPNGQYWIDPSNSDDPFTVFCDMQTDGGGWTLIAQTVAKNMTKLTPMIREKNYRMISNYNSGIVRIDVPAIFQFKQLTRFTQIRFYCHKNSTGRTFHIMTKNDINGESIVKYLIEDPSIQPRACASFERLPGDNAYLSVNCLKWGNDGTRGECDKWGSFKNKGSYRVYNDPIFWENKHYVNMKPSILACDDSYSSPAPLSLGDTWQIFVR
ncbi:Angiopoietin-4 [Stylophora pistillata]|uniref:Angiopoietin-4 n=1 Tax=Stylophora pistillata TaxID=50429 RepID=A0A2B4RLC2_STYPI|nr:Angiopoietin-4 [Stylophora pistillata]